MKSKSDHLYFDATDLKCPLLFVKTKQWINRLEPNGRLQLKVNNRDGSENIKMYLDKLGLAYTVSETVTSRSVFWITAKEQ
ncbi:MAG: sulfurtransferase TusA family protein [Psychrosphaera sp.]|nr:sulfurtransferase TusA family protein [Psychrosphaera sp.]